MYLLLIKKLSYKYIIIYKHMNKLWNTRPMKKYSPPKNTRKQYSLFYSLTHSCTFYWRKRAGETSLLYENEPVLILLLICVFLATNNTTALSHLIHLTWHQRVSYFTTDPLKRCWLQTLEGIKKIADRSTHHLMRSTVTIFRNGNRVGRGVSIKRRIL